MRTSNSLPRFEPVRLMVLWLGLAAVFVICFAAETNSAEGDQASREPVAEDHQLLELFDETLPEEAHWEAKTPERIVRDGGGFAGERWAYMRT